MDMGHATDIDTPCSIMKSCFVWRITELSLAGNTLYYRENLPGWIGAVAAMSTAVSLCTTLATCFFT